jgi:hypothetical protein
MWKIFSERIVVDVVSVGTSSYVIVDGDPLVVEGSGATASFKSEYNVLPEGLGMEPIHTDVARHLSLKSTYSSSFPNYLFYLKETIQGKEFIDNEIYFPAGLYSLPRKGRASVGYTSPPLSTETTPVLNNRNITNADKLEVTRSTNPRIL